MKASAPLILLADDFEDAREMYTEWLTFKGYRVVQADDGETAIESARRHRPDLILLDVRMPRLTGDAAIEILRADPSFAGTPIAALTAHALDVEREALFAHGFDAVLSKPVLPDALLVEIERLLGRGASSVS